MTKKRRRGPDRRVGKPLSMRQMLALATGPREDPGPFNAPRWDEGEFESDAEALAAWHYWKDQLKEDWFEVFDETPEWVQRLEAGDD